MCFHEFLKKINYIYIYVCIYIYIQVLFNSALTDQRKHNLRVEFETTFGEKLSDGGNLKEKKCGGVYGAWSKSW
jgi:hypothetical protein